MFEVSRQNVNCGPVQTLTCGSLAEAQEAFDWALRGGVQFASIFDLDQDCEVQRYLAPARHTRY